MSVRCPIPLGFPALGDCPFDEQKTAPRHEKSRSMTYMPLGAAFLITGVILAGMGSVVNIGATPFILRCWWGEGGCGKRPFLGKGSVLNSQKSFQKLFPTKNCYRVRKIFFRCHRIESKKGHNSLSEGPIRERSVNVEKCPGRLGAFESWGDTFTR